MCLLFITFSPTVCSENCYHLVLVFKTKFQEGVDNGLRNKFGPTNVITVNAMRPEFQLGSLYDRRTDNLLPNQALWKKDSLNKKKLYREKISSSQQWLIDSENTFSSKVRKLDMETGLTLSLLGEMVDIKGHAKYLQDTTLTKNMAKVSLTFNETSVYQELVSDSLCDIDYQDILTSKEEKVAFTHVVVGIQYGGISTVVFEKNVKENESKGEAEEVLSLALKAIAASKDGIMNLSSDLKRKLENIKCTIYSDFISDAKILNWDDALSPHKPFPTLLSPSGDFENDRGVPVRIWLLPKVFFGSHHNIILQEISSNFVIKSKEIIESLTRVINESQDLLNEMKNFSILSKNVARFLNAIENYKSTFHKSTLRSLVFSVRNGSEDENLLSYSLQKYKSSPFAYLDQCLKKLKGEADTLLFIKKQLSDAGVLFVSKDFLQSNAKEGKSVVLTLQVSKRKDKFISEMENYNLAQTETLLEVENILNEKPWFDDGPLKEQILGMVYKMRNFAYANQNNEDAGFFIREAESEEIPECQIEAWENGKKLCLQSCEILIEIQNLCVERYSHDTMEIKWRLGQEKKSNISTYQIEVNRLSDGEETQRLELSSKAKFSLPSGDIMAHEVINLQPGNTYKISLQCFCLNDSIVSKPVEIFQMMRFSNPPVEFKAEVIEKRLVKLSWENPTILAKGAICKGFLIEYKTTTKNTWQNRLVQADLNTYIFSDLHYVTEYKFRIKARYKKGEETLPTEEIHLRTESMNVVQIKKV